MKVLAIDPGSKVTGYAILAGLGPEELLECGLLKGSAAEIDRPPAGWEQHMASPELAAWRRIVSIAGEVGILYQEVNPGLVVIEIPSGLIGTGAKNRARGALTTYGMAAGFIAARCGDEELVVPVTERQWIGRRNPKRCRMATMATIYPQNDWLKIDPGGDARDAIALGRWAIKQLMNNESTTAST